MLSHDAEVDGFDVLRTLGDDDDMGTGEARDRLAQHPCRHQCIFIYGAIIVHQHDVDAGRDVTMLKGVVKDDDLDIF